MAKKKKKPETDPRWDELYRNYQRGTQDMEARTTRKNGWNDTVKAYLNQFPANWPFQAKVAEPLIRTTILEKNGRLLNSKLRGRVVPREGGDMIKAEVNNALLDFQWDNADRGGSMLEKVAMCDLNTRLFGIAYAWVYWDVEKDCNEIKVLDVRDVLLDPRLTHIRSAGPDNWIQIREWLSPDALEAQGYDVPVLETTTPDARDNSYTMIVKNIRGISDEANSTEEGVIEVVHQLTPEKTTTFLPRHKLVIREKQEEHNRIQVAMLRYYPLPEDIVGESEVEPVIGIARTVNWFLSGFTEEGNLLLHPPTIIPEAGVRRETIVHKPKAIWIANNPDSIRRELPVNGIIGAFNNVYPMLKNAFNTAMGSQSLGVSPMQGGSFNDKTATEVKGLEAQQNTRDQYNQLYLGEFLKDIMMMWVENNKRYLFDDPSKTEHIMKIIGGDMMKKFQQLGLHDQIITPEASQMLSHVVDNNPGLQDTQIQDMVQASQTPKYPVVTNPDASPENYNVVPKLEMTGTNEGVLHVTKDDFEGLYDFIPDVVSMGAGAGQMQKDGRLAAFNLATTPNVTQDLMTDGWRLKTKELLSTIFEDNNFSDASNYFEKIQQQPTGQPTVQGMPGLTPPQGLGGLPVPGGMAPANGGMAAPGPQASPFPG